MTDSNDPTPDNPTTDDPKPAGSRWELWKNVIGFVICGGLLLFYLIRNLPVIVASGGDPGDAFNWTGYVIYFLFGSLTLVFGYRAINAAGKA